MRISICNLALFTLAVSTSVVAADLPRIRVSSDGSHFVAGENNESIVLRGFNYDHDAEGHLIEDYWHDQWSTVLEDFGEMKELGANVVRIHLQLPKFMTSATEPNEKNLAKLKELITLAEQNGLYLDLTGLGCYHKADVPDWYDNLSDADRWDVQARFWQAVATTCSGSPAVFCYDLMNEPVLPGKTPETDWLTGELSGKYFVQRISLDLKGRTRSDVAKAWIAKLASAIRDVDQSTLITIGVIPWAHVWPNAKPVFHDPEVSQPIDFVSVHFYPRKGEVDKAIAALKVYDIGKPVVVEEFFPLNCGYDDAKQFIDGTRSIADGWISFYWGQTPEQYRELGDMKSGLIAGWLDRFPANVLSTDAQRKN